MQKITQQPSSPFGKWVLQVLTEHGATLRSQRQRTGLSHTTVMGWLQDVRPTMEGVIHFARGFSQDVNSALALAEYEPIEETDPDRLADQLLDIAEKQPEELTYDPDLEQLSVKGFQGAEGLTERDLDSIDRAMRLLIQQRRSKYGHRIEGAEE